MKLVYDSNRFKAKQHSSFLWKLPSSEFHSHKYTKKNQHPYRIARTHATFSSLDGFTGFIFHFALYRINNAASDALTNHISLQG